MPLGPDPSRAGAVLARLDALRAAVAEAEDDVLACLVVTGEPRPQRVLDDWLDQVADTLRALGEAAADLAPVAGRYAVAVPDVARGEPSTASGAPSTAGSAPSAAGVDVAAHGPAGDGPRSPRSPGPADRHDRERS